MNNYRYICSFILDDSDKFISLNDSQFSEVEMSFLINRNGQFRFKLVDQEGNQMFVPVNEIGFPSKWLQFMKYSAFSQNCIVVRAVYRKNNVRGRPYLLRLYMLSTKDIIENFYGQINYLAVEESIFELLNSYHTTTIIENKMQITQVQNFLTDNATDVCAFSPLKSPIPPKRSHGTEQRDNATSLLEIVQYGLRKFDFNENIPIFNGYFFDVVKESISLCESTKRSFIRGSIVFGIMGCGRKRTYSIMIEQIANRCLPPTNSCPIDRYNAQNLSIIFCKKETIPKWCLELSDVNTLVIDKNSDFDNLTYEFVEKGGVILCSNEGLVRSFDIADDEWKKAREVIVFYESVLKGEMYLEKSRCIRYHVNDLSKRFPSAKVPLQWLHFRMVIVDDIIDMNEFDVEHADYVFGRLHQIPESEIISNIGFLSYDWSFLHVKTTGNLPTHVPLQWLNAVHPIVSDPQDDVYEKPALFVKLFQIYGGLQTLRTPKNILRKVTLVSVPVEPSENEMKIFKKLSVLHKELTLSAITGNDISLFFLGEEFSDFCDKSSYPIIAKRLFTKFSLEDAIDHAKSHFYDNDTSIPGTIAERIRSVHMSADPNFFFSSIKSLKECNICFEEKSDMITLCGHGFCEGCEMLLMGNSLTIQCPICRASLCEYDWIRLSETTSVSSSVTMSKHKILKQKVEQIVSRKRKKATLDSSVNCLILLPDEDVPVTEKFLNENFKNFAYFSYQDFVKKYKKEMLCNEIVAVFMISPAQETEVYQVLVRCTNRISPLQVYILNIPAIESMDIAMETIVNPQNENRSGRRRYSEDLFTLTNN